MCNALVRAAMRHGMSRLNRGDYALMLTLGHPDFELSFPGRNSWSTMFREPSLGRHRQATHIGISEGRAFADRFVAAGIQFEVEDILVNGPSSNTRVALGVHDFVPGPAGQGDRYNNRAVLFLELRWGRLVRWEDYEDTERTATWDATRGVSPVRTG